MSQQRFQELKNAALNLGMSEQDAVFYAAQALARELAASR